MWMNVALGQARPTREARVESSLGLRRPGRGDRMVRGRAGCDDQAPVMGIGAALDLPGRPAVIEPRGHRRGWP